MKDKVSQYAPLKKLIYRAGNITETSTNKLKLQFRNRLGLHTPVQIIPYITYGTVDRLYLKGRVLRERTINITELDTRARNLLNMYRRIASTRISGARLKVSLNETELEAVTDSDGYFEFSMPLAKSLPEKELWHHPVVELLEAPVKLKERTIAKGQVLVLPSTARFGVISDIDDTILTSHTTHWLRMTKLAFFHNAHTRVPFHGVAEFYCALQKGTT